MLGVQTCQNGCSRSVSVTDCLQGDRLRFHPSRGERATKREVHLHNVSANRNHRSVLARELSLAASIFCPAACRAKTGYLSFPGRWEERKSKKIRQKCCIKLKPSGSGSQHWHPFKSIVSQSAGPYGPGKHGFCASVAPAELSSATLGSWRPVDIKVCHSCLDVMPDSSEGSHHV